MEHRRIAGSELAIYLAPAADRERLCSIYDRRGYLLEHLRTVYIHARFKDRSFEVGTVWRTKLGPPASLVVSIHTHRRDRRHHRTDHWVHRVCRWCISGLDRLLTRPQKIS